MGGVVAARPGCAPSRRPRPPTAPGCPRPPRGAAAWRRSVRSRRRWSSRRTRGSAPPARPATWSTVMPSGPVSRCCTTAGEVATAEHLDQPPDDEERRVAVRELRARRGTRAVTTRASARTRPSETPPFWHGLSRTPDVWSISSRGVIAGLEPANSGSHRAMSSSSPIALVVDEGHERRRGQPLGGRRHVERRRRRHAPDAVLVDDRTVVGGDAQEPAAEPGVRRLAARARRRRRRTRPARVRARRWRGSSSVADGAAVVLDRASDERRRRGSRRRCRTIRPHPASAKVARSTASAADPRRHASGRGQVPRGRMPAAT